MCSKKFEKYENIKVVKAESQDVLHDLINKNIEKINFWLDGHYSGGVTFSGKLETPILEELKIIANHLDNFNKVCILVDDVRCFSTEQFQYFNYPHIDKLIEWAKINQFSWYIEHDILIFTKQILERHATP